MEKQQMLLHLFNSWKDPIVLVDRHHIIRYLNKSAKERYSRFGDVTGKSIFECHNENSCKAIKDAFDKFKEGQEEVLISSKENRRVYMRAFYDENKNLSGYYEHYDYTKK